MWHISVVYVRLCAFTSFEQRKEKMYMYGYGYRERLLQKANVQAKILIANSTYNVCNSANAQIHAVHTKTKWKLFGLVTLEYSEASI